MSRVYAIAKVVGRNISGLRPVTFRKLTNDELNYLNLIVDKDGLFHNLKIDYDQFNDYSYDLDIHVQFITNQNEINVLKKTLWQALTDEYDLITAVILQFRHSRMKLKLNQIASENPNLKDSIQILMDKTEYCQYINRCIEGYFDSSEIIEIEREILELEHFISNPTSKCPSFDDPKPVSYVSGPIDYTQCIWGVNIYVKKPRRSGTFTECTLKQLCRIISSQGQYDEETDFYKDLMVYKYKPEYGHRVTITYSMIKSVIQTMIQNSYHKVYLQIQSKTSE